MAKTEFSDIAFPRVFDFNYNKDKRAIFDYFAKQFTIRALGMFEWENVPETLSVREMELELLMTGTSRITKVDGELYAMRGGYAGSCNPDYLPQEVVVTNPYIPKNEGYAKNLVIGKEAVVVWNDDMLLGLYDLISLYASQLAEAHTTLRLQLVNARANKFLSASKDSVKDDAIRVLHDIEDGKLGVIGDRLEMEAMMKSLESTDFGEAKSDSLKSTIEAIQYLSAQFNIALGLNDNYNMKREAVNSSETSVNEDTLFSLPLNMLKCRKKGAEDINHLYGTDISVKFAGVWDQAFKKYELSLALEKEEIEAVSEAKTTEVSGKKEENENE